MGFYNKYVLPKLTDWACKQNPNMRQREKVIPLAYGKVLEVGIGTGLNLTYYDPSRVDHLTGIDPSEDNWKMRSVNDQDIGFQIDFILSSADNIPADNNQFDSAVITYTLCSIIDPVISLEEIRRVLKPKGQLIFCEHGLAPDKNIRQWQHTLNPLWKMISGGCNMTRDIPDLLHQGGFEIKDMDTLYLPGWRILSYNFWGTACAK
jgi:ubiquinone/menaquinone biosynthesis C-methylase UbiE